MNGTDQQNRDTPGETSLKSVELHKGYIWLILLLTAV